MTNPSHHGRRAELELQVLSLLRWLMIAAVVVIGWLVLKFLAHILTPVLAAFGIAYLVNPLVTGLQARGIRRSIGSALVLVGFIAAVVSVITALAPRLANDLAHFVHDLPKMIDSLSRWLSESFGIELPKDWAAYLKSDDVKNMLGDASGPIKELAAAVLGGILHLLATFAELLLVPVFAYYFLLDWGRLTRQLYKLVPPRNRASVEEIVADIDRVVSGWVRGQAIVTAILAVLYAISFSIVGMPLAVPIGLLVGVLTVIPFVGTFVGAGIAIGLTLLDGGGLEQVSQVGGVILVLHLLEAAVLTPKIVGHRVGLGESSALFAVVAGGKVLGFVGIVLAVPIAATTAVLLRRAYHTYSHSEFYGEEVAPVPVTKAMAVVAMTPMADHVAEPAADAMNDPTAGRAPGGDDPPEE